MNILNIIKLIVSLLICTIPGYLLVQLATKEINNFYEKSMLAVGLGLGINGIIIFLLGIAHIPISYLSVLSSEIILFIVFLVFCRLQRVGIIPKAKNLSINLQNSWLEKGLIAYLLVKCAYSLFEALIKPVTDWDAWARYSLVAKGILLKGTFLNPYLLGRLEDYPPLVIFNQAWFLIGQGAWNDITLKIIGPVLFISLICIFYINLKDTLNKTSALFYCALLASLPFLLYHSSTAYLDFPLTCFYTISTLYLIRHMRNDDPASLNISLLYLGFCVWIKRGGTYLAIINLLALLIFYLLKYKPIKIQTLMPRAAYAIGIVLGMALPWLIYNRIVVENHYDQITSIIGSAVSNTSHGDLLSVLQIMTNKIFLSANWHLAALLFIVSLAFFFKNNQIKNLLLFIITMNMLVLIYIFTLTDSYAWLLDGTLFNRVFMYTVPLLLIYSALNIGNLPEKWSIKIGAKHNQKNS